jgi:hypothetical protein
MEFKKTKQIKSFRHSYMLWASGTTDGTISEASILPVTELPTLAEITSNLSQGADTSLLKETVNLCAIATVLYSFKMNCKNWLLGPNSCLIRNSILEVGNERFMAHLHSEGLEKRSPNGKEYCLVLIVYALLFSTLTILCGFSLTTQIGGVEIERWLGHFDGLGLRQIAAARQIRGQFP